MASRSYTEDARSGEWTKWTHKSLQKTESQRRRETSTHMWTKSTCPLRALETPRRPTNNPNSHAQVALTVRGEDCNAAMDREFSPSVEQTLRSDSDSTSRSSSSVVTATGKSGVCGLAEGKAVWRCSVLASAGNGSTVLEPSGRTRAAAGCPPGPPGAIGLLGVDLSRRKTDMRALVSAAMSLAMVRRLDGWRVRAMLRGRLVTVMSGTRKAAGVDDLRGWKYAEGGGSRLAEEG